MPKSQKNPAASASLHNLPYQRLGNRNQPEETTPNRAPSVTNVVQFDKLEIGSYYNCAISFLANTPNAKVPTALPKHRVILSRLCEVTHTVEVYYLTTFAGKRDPRTFHENHKLKKLMYVPVAPLVHNEYLSITSTPPVMRGWCNFARPAEILYADETPSRELLRYCPESFGIAPPLLHGRITIAAWQMKYIRALNTGWGNTIKLKSPIEDWMAKAKHLREKYLAQNQIGPEGSAVDVVPDTEDWGNEPVWTGITCLRGGLGTESEDEDERFDLQDIINSIESPAFTTPPRPPAAQSFPTPPLSIGRTASAFQETEALATLSTTHPPFPSYLARDGGHEPPTVWSEHQSGNDTGEEFEDVEYPEWGGITSLPEWLAESQCSMSEPEVDGVRHDDGSYTTVTVFWQISNLESDAEEMDEETWNMVLRGRPGPGLHV